MNTINLSIESPTLNGGKVMFVFVKLELGDGSAVCRIHPADKKNQIMNIAPRGNPAQLLLTRECKRDLVIMRDTLQEVFNANGMNFASDTASDYNKLERRLTNDTDRF